MVYNTEQTTIVKADFSDAEAVYLLGPFNRWSTTATPMRREPDGGWIAELPRSRAENLSFFVWDRGARCGRLVRCCPVETQAGAYS
jgi:hypothetical protein